MIFIAVWPAVVRGSSLHSPKNPRPWTRGVACERPVGDERRRCRGCSIGISQQLWILALVKRALFVRAAGSAFPVLQGRAFQICGPDIVTGRLQRFFRLPCPSPSQGVEQGLRSYHQARRGWGAPKPTVTKLDEVGEPLGTRRGNSLAS